MLKRKFWALLFALCMIALLLTGCNKTTTEETEPTSVAVDYPEVSEEAQEADAENVTAPEPDNTGQESSEPVPEVEQEPSPEEEPEEAYSVSYPLSDGSVELSIWNPLNTAFTMLISSYSELPSLPIVEEATGIQVSFMEPSESTANEQFNLVIASGDYPDLFNTSYYSGGAEKAYFDDVIYELSELAPQYAPDYFRYISDGGNDISKAILNDEGNMLYITSILDEYTYENGLVIRQDWLDELNLNAPKTIDDLKEVLASFNSVYGCTNTFHVNSSGVMPFVYGAFGTASFDLSGSNGTDLGLYHVGDTVYSTITSDGYREYLEYFIELYNEGLIDKEFYSFAMSYDSMTRITVLGAAGIWDTMVDTFVSTTNQAIEETPNYRLMGIANIVKDENSTNEFASIPVTVNSAGVAISTTCDYPEKAVSFINWFFTDEGYIVANYGVEGESFIYDLGGQPEFTDLVINNPDGYNMMNIKNFYAFNYGAAYTSQKPIQAYFTDDQLETLEVWKDGSNYSRTLPSVTLTSEESELFINTASDIKSYAAESFLKFIVGDDELNDDSWNEVQSQLKLLNIDECVAIYQGAYDRYLSR